MWTPGGPAPHIQTARANLCSHFASAPLQRAAVPRLYGRTPCQVFQAHGQGRGSGLEARSLLKYLNYVIDVSTVINLAAARPSGRLLPTQFLGRLWSSCQTGPDDGGDDGACVFKCDTSLLKPIVMTNQKKRSVEQTRLEWQVFVWGGQGWFCGFSAPRLALIGWSTKHGRRYSAIQM